MRGMRFFEAKRSRALRSTATAAEAALWKRLRARKLNGLKFVRQEPIGPYFADFACRECRLVVEIDGATHSTPEEVAGDARRTAFLAGEGWRVVRFGNVEVAGNMNGVLETILAVLEGRANL